MKQTVIRTGQIKGYNDLAKKLEDGWIVVHISTIGAELEYILEKQEIK
jgi:hypothetical protein